MRKLANRNRLTTALAVVGAFVAFFVVMSALNRPIVSEVQFGPSFDIIQRMFWPELGLASLAVGLVALFGWLRDVRLTSPVAARSARILILPGLMMLALVAVGEVTTLTTGISPTSEQVMTVARTMLLVGVFEEVVFRGILLHGLESRIGTLRAAFASSLLFGLMHYTNWLSGQHGLLTHLQVLHACSIGLLMGAIVVRTNSLWPAIILHAVWNTLLTLTALRVGPVQPALPSANEFAPLVGLIVFELAIALSILAFWARRQRQLARTLI